MHDTEARFRLSTGQPTSEGASARPLRADAARNRLKVLDAARAAFAEHGLAAQMDDVARRAGVGVGTVYRHFPTKEALALAMVEQRFDGIVAHMREELLPDPDPWHAIARSFEHCGTTQEQDRSYAAAVTTLAGSVSPNGDPAAPCAAQIEELNALTAELLARAHRAGVVRADLRAEDMPPFYAALSAIVQAGVEDWRRYVEIVLDGLRAPARR